MIGEYYIGRFLTKVKLKKVVKDRLKIREVIIDNALGYLHDEDKPDLFWQSRLKETVKQYIHLTEEVSKLEWALDNE